MGRQCSLSRQEVKMFSFSLIVLSFAAYASCYTIDDASLPQMDCATTSGEPCQFPFTHEGRSYGFCITGENGSLRCPTALGADRSVSNWAACEPSSCRHACTSVSGKRCIFPFSNNGRVNQRCARDGDEEPWCATSVDTEGKLLEKESCNMEDCPLD